MSDTRKCLYVYGDLDYEIRDRIDVLKKALEDVRNTLGEICEDEIECGHVETGKDWLDYHKKYSKAKEEMEELLRTVQSGRMKDYMEEVTKSSRQLIEFINKMASGKSGVIFLCFQSCRKMLKEVYH